MMALLTCVVRVVGMRPRYRQSPNPISLSSRSPSGRAVWKPAMWERIFILDRIPSSMVGMLKRISILLLRVFFCVLVFRGEFLPTLEACMWRRCSEIAFRSLGPPDEVVLFR